MSKPNVQRVKASLLNYLDREAKKRERELKPSRKNKAPEKDLVSEILKQCKKFGFDLYVTDSAAKWDNQAERYVANEFASGMSDLSGDRGGIACYIEIKAPGKRVTLKENQRDFLIRKINRGCFAMCADSWRSIPEIFARWQIEGCSKYFLKNHLPPRRKSRKKNDEQGELPF